jgi:hexosaminidase
VCRFIDLAAWHKFNVFHWHLTDDQGWRLPIAGYERLVEVAAWREGTLIGHDSGQAQVEIDGVPHGGCYTAEEIQRVVAYAAVRGVRILPEVDVPGHVQALLTAYPEMGTTDRVPGVRPRWGISESTLNLEPVTFEFLARVVETLAELFPFPFIHFGGDEAKTEEWAASARVQEQKRERGLTSDRDVQGVFTEELQCWAKRHGRRFMGWDEVVDSGKLTEEAAVMFWRDEGLETEPRDRAALAMGLPLVLANWSWTYFDHYQVAEADRSSEPLAIGGELPLEKVYRWAPLARYEPEWHAQILGAQAQVWTEYIPTQAHLDYMVYPRACAMAQVLWTGSQREDWEAFQARLSEHLPRLGRRGVAYRPIKAKG